jgi:hypothetical protein
VAALDEARRLYEDGFVNEAAKIVHRERLKAAASHDSERLKEIDVLVSQMRGHLSGRGRTDFDERVARGSTAEKKDEVDLSPVGLILASVGALLMLVSAFLPFADESGFTRVKDNTLIQQGWGWAFVGLAIVDAGAIYRAYRFSRRTGGPLFTGLGAVALAIYLGTSDSVLRLCPVNPLPSLNIPCEKASPGVGIFAAGIGGLLLAAGGFQLLAARRRAPMVSEADTDSKVCPECAETVKAAARVCKHCGYRFAPAVSDSSDARLS